MSWTPWSDDWTERPALGVYMTVLIESPKIATAKGVQPGSAFVNAARIVPHQPYAGLTSWLVQIFVAFVSKFNTNEYMITAISY
jgi:hypothetical protein